MFNKPTLQKNKDEVAELARQKIMLQDQVRILGGEQERLDTIVKNHEAQKAQLSDLQSSIDEANAKLSETNNSISSLARVKTDLDKAKAELDALAPKKQEAMEAITFGMSKVRVLQEEIDNFGKYSDKIKKEHTDAIAKLQGDIERVQKAKNDAIQGLQTVINLIK